MNNYRRYAIMKFFDSRAVPLLETVNTALTLRSGLERRMAANEPSIPTLLCLPSLSANLGKKCPECLCFMGFNSFHRCKSTVDGFEYVCIKCRRYQRFFRKEIGFIFDEINTILDRYAIHCYECGSWKMLNEFPKKSDRANGHTPPCLACKRAHLVANTERINAQRRGFYDDNKVAVRARNRIYWEKNKETIRAINRLWAKNNPEKVREILNRRHARLLNAPINDFTESQWRFIKKLYRYQCVYCGVKPKKLTKDHIIPLSKGGSHTATNIVPACRLCNNKKYTGPPIVPVQPILPGIAV